MPTSILESLPVELVAEIFSSLDLRSLVIVSYLSKSLYTIASDPSLNPWRKPILCNLRSSVYELSLKHLSVRTIVPRQNWIEILSLARASFILFEATLPNLTSSEWEECFARRFLPGWRRWKKDNTWKEAFLKILSRVWHRSTTSCTSDEAWTSYIVLNRNGTANEVEGSSRHFNPSAIIDELKAQSDLAHLETRVRVVVELADVRVLAFGTLSKRTPLSYNANAHAFLHPPGIEQRRKPSTVSHQVRDHGVYPMGISSGCANYDDGSNTYAHMRHPVPASSFINYPFFTPGGSDRRWSGFRETEEGGLQWVGKMLIVAQIIGLNHNSAGEAGEGRQQYASFTWGDLCAIAPWVDEMITKKIQDQYRPLPSAHQEKQSYEKTIAQQSVSLLRHYTALFYILLGTFVPMIGGEGPGKTCTEFGMYWKNLSKAERSKRTWSKELGSPLLCLYALRHRLPG